MNNYEYITASLPVLIRNGKDIPSSGEVIEEISHSLDSGDKAILDQLLEGFDPDKLDRDFYRKAFASRDRFIREYFAFDLELRNAKVRYLNKRLLRPLDTDTILFEDIEDSDSLPAIEAVLDTDDLLSREKGLDDLLWDKAGSIVELDIFSLDIILSFVVKLMILSRWASLDPEEGRVLLRKLVKEIKETRNI